METIAQTTPRSLEVLAEHVRKVAHCQWCDTPAGKHWAFTAVAST